MPTAEAVLAAPIRGSQAATLLVTSVVMMGSPGPATISLAAAGSAYGVRRSAGFLAGIITGTAAVLVAVATGITAALLARPALRAVLIALAAAYLLWLAYHIATAPPITARRAAQKPPSLPGGALLGIANPKAWIAIAAVFASAQLSGNVTTDAVAKTAALTVMIVLINACWLVAGASLAPLLRAPRPSRILNVAMAVALVATTGYTLWHQL